MSVESSDRLFEDYFSNMEQGGKRSTSTNLNPNWKNLMTNIEEIGKKGLISRQNDLDWCLAENGVTYNVYNDPKGLNRPWQLNVIPTVIHENEWMKIEKGIKQRAEILDLILKDIYGERRLIKDGILPQEIIYNHQGFLRQCDKITYPTDKHLLIHSSDIARGPDGRMWVINDRTQAPSGMGYALENRLTMGRVLPDLFTGVNIKRLSLFFKHLDKLLIESYRGRSNNPNIVVLTPGPHNETYFEHAYLASSLNYSLVQGDDLSVRNGYVWMKSLKGLTKVDIILRRVDDIFCDPLELRDDSHLGVVGLLEVIRKGNVSVVNPIGSRILENFGLNPFMNSIANYFLNEDLLLPQIPTWWCGQQKEKQYVLDHLSELIVKRIDKANSLKHIYIGEKMTKSELADLSYQIKEKPYQFVAQGKIGFSTTPTFVDGKFEPRRSTLRTFAIANDKEYSVMPGGLERVAAQKGNILVSNQSGGTSKDVWVVSDNEQPAYRSFILNRRLKGSNQKIGIENLPSLTAENLFWAGRYVGRTLITIRYIRTVLRQMTFSKFKEDERKPAPESLEALFKGLTYITSTFPGFAEEGKEEKLNNPLAEIKSVIFDENRPGSLAYTLSLFYNAYYSIRDLWSSDMWRVFDSIKRCWMKIKDKPDIDIREIIQGLDRLITRIIAFMGLVQECILIEQGLLLYFIGLQMEQGMMTISKFRSLLINKQSDQVEYEILESILSTHESLNVYRYSYRSYITIENVFDLLLLDLKHPRSLAYHLSRLNKDISILPHSKVSNQLTDYEKYIFEAFSKIRLTNSRELSTISEGDTYRENLEKVLEDIFELLGHASVSISNTYFSHIYKQNQLISKKIFTS